jgi:hypothetical protein
MRNTLKTIVNYVLIGVIGVIPIVLIFQIVIHVERFLKDFVLLWEQAWLLRFKPLFACNLYNFLASCAMFIAIRC